ncbi:pilus assembly protein [Acidithiobacillus sp. HP-6]|uniref:TadG family pilus assembly protein n=1 Tax=unclassified Acidithiobacillus TaxID=2614800 RepID=UPI001879B960|nr:MULTISPECIES: TadG family pilus assembly protein [unclassified Acidithiobacillus]MBE7564020.1 pilus assembly protein [Acidithiobacillus sp. HP-6]MBE7569579.1 pilus assembly protein [Acidithiobacillus sp. HP-2]
MKNWHLRHKESRNDEKGSLVIMTALVLPIVMLIVFGAIDISHAIYVQRHLQKIADMAAIAGAENITDAANTANQNALTNGFQSTAPGRVITVNTGNWNPDTQAAPSYFSTTVPSGSQTNAVQVQVSQQVPYFLFLGPPLTLHAQAIAWAPSAAGISISSQVLDLDSTQSPLLNSILGGLLGSSLNLKLLGYQGLATTTISLGNLAQSVGVGSVNSLLSANLTLPQLYEGALTVLGNQASGGILNNQQASGALSSIIGATRNTATIQLSKILNLGLAKQAAVDARVNLLDLITASAMLANQQHAVDVPGVNLLGLASLRLYIISPPQLAYGEGGKNAQGQWITQAKTAQVALELRLLGSLLHVVLEASPAVADLKQVVCASPQSQSSVAVRAGTSLLSASVNLLSNSSFQAIPPGNYEDHTFTGLPIPRAAESHGNKPWTVNSTGQNQQSVTLDLNLLGLKVKLGDVLSPVISLLAPVLQILGISLGTAEVKYTALSCGNAVLVY